MNPSGISAVRCNCGYEVRGRPSDAPIIVRCPGCSDAVELSPLTQQGAEAWPMGGDLHDATPTKVPAHH
jgi:hypothetical protein